MTVTPLWHLATLCLAVLPQQRLAQRPVINMGPLRMPPVGHLPRLASGPGEEVPSPLSWLSDRQGLVIASEGWQPSVPAHNETQDWLDALLQDLPLFQQAFAAKLDRVAQRLCRQSDLPPLQLTVAQPKSEARIRSKVAGELGGNPRMLFDALRGRLAFALAPEAASSDGWPVILAEVRRQLTQAGFEVVVLQDHYHRPYPSGYRCYKFQLRFVFEQMELQTELQVTSQAMAQIASSAFDHALYTQDSPAATKAQHNLYCQVASQEGLQGPDDPCHVWYEENLA